MMEQNKTDEVKGMFESRVINAEPMYLLADCIAADEKRRAALDRDDEYKNPIEDIAERFHTYIFLCNEAELSFLRYAAELSEKKAAWGDNISYNPASWFISADLIYLFLWEDTYYLVLPDELAAIYRDAMLSSDFAAENAYKLELSDYAAALLNLYGAYEIEQFVLVWNHHHKNKITYEEAENFLSDRAYFHSDFYFAEGFVVHDCLFYDDFDELWETTETMEYYMPTKSVIRQYKNKGYDDSKIPGEREMDTFLAEYVKDEVKLDDLQLSVSLSVHHLTEATVILRDLIDADAPIDDEDFRAKFERLYNNMRNDSHIWELRGYTLHQFGAETGEAVPRFKLPKVKAQKKKTRKAGR